MKKLTRFIAALLLLMAVPSAAHADPVTSSIVAIGAFISANAAMIALVLSVSTTLLAMAGAKGKGQNGGIKSSTTAGGATAQTFIMGHYCTAGHLMMPLATFGAEKKTPNAYLVYVVAVGAMKNHSLEQIVIADNYAVLGTGSSSIGSTGLSATPINGDYENHAWYLFRDGNQTEADPFLIDALGGDPERPFDVTMVGKGLSYVVVILRYNREIFNSPPALRFEVKGIPLYDPRQDGSLPGHTGPHRWGQPETWLKLGTTTGELNQTTNPVVMIYNIHRGITLPDGLVWGGVAEAEDLPLDNWEAAMNACDQVVNISTGGTEAQYRAGIEISVDEEPADVIEKLMIACNAQTVQIGGVWKIRVGGPALPTFFFTDDDVLTDHDNTHSMFMGLDETNNAIHGTHPLPESLWETVDAPPRYDDTYEAEDDNQRLVATVSMECVYSPSQAQRIMDSLLKDNRRFRRHGLSLGPAASVLEPLDSVRWYSEREGYTVGSGKTFEVGQTIEGMRSVNMQLALRERDGADFDPNITILPIVIPNLGANIPVAQNVPDWEAEGGILLDKDGNERKAAIFTTWDGTEMPDVNGIMIEVRLKEDLSDVWAGQTADIERNGLVLTEGILPNEDYQVRGKLIANRATNWTGWTDVHTPDVRLSEFDLPPDLVNKVNTNSLEWLKLRTDLTTYRQVTDALLYTGDGRSVQLVSVSAENKAADAIYKFNLIGALSPDASSYVLDSSIVKLTYSENGSTVTQALSSIITSNVTRIGDNEAAVEIVSDSVDGVKANYFLKARAGTDIMAGLYLGADDTVGTSTIGFIAQNFFFADNSNPGELIYPFIYIPGSPGEWTINANVKINGDVVVNGSITTEKLIENAVSEYASEDFAGVTNLGTEKVVASITFNPDQGRVRLSWRINIDNPGGDDCAVRLKIYRNGVWNNVSLLFISRSSFTTVVTSYFNFDETSTTSNVTYAIKIQTVTGTNIGHTGGTPYTAANSGGANITAESFKR